MKFLSVLLFAFFLFSSFELSAQSEWASWSREIDAKDYEGLPFRITAKVKAETINESASARLWARIDKVDGKRGTFENMWKTPITSKEWKEYSISGVIDKGVQHFNIGLLLELNGSFYFDDVTAEVQKDGKWTKIFVEDFEKGFVGWKPGTAAPSGNAGVNNLYTAKVEKDPATKNQYLKITATDIVAYGDNKKAGKFAEVNGIKLYYEIYGEGTPLVILHGNGGSIKSVSGFYPELSKQYKIIAIDNRSQGKSTDNGKPLNYLDMAADVNALLEKINVDSALYWGQSDGGIIGLLMAIHYPSKVKKVLAFAPNLRPDSTAVYDWAVSAVRRIADSSKDPQEKKLYSLMRDYPNIPVSDLKKIKAPVFLMGGDRDVIKLEHFIEMFRNIPNSHLCILPGSTHGGSVEKREIFKMMMNDFFTKPFKMPTTEDWFK